MIVAQTSAIPLRCIHCFGIIKPFDGPTMWVQPAVGCSGRAGPLHQACWEKAYQPVLEVVPPPGVVLS